MKTILLALFFLLFAADAFSAVKTWDGGGANNNWTTAANWVNDVAPVANDDLVFPATAAQYATNNNFFFLTQFNSLTFEGGVYTVDGNPMFLRGLNVTGTQAINTAVFVAAQSQPFNAAAGATVTLAVVSLGAQPLVLNGDGSYGIGVISGSGAITKNGAGAALIATSSNFTGSITLNNGILVVDANIPSSPVTVNGGAIGGGQFGFSGFGGTGTVGAMNVTTGVISAGTLESLTGILNINTSLTFSANGTYACKLSGTTPGANGHDQLNVTGTVALNNAVLAPIPFGTFQPAIGDSFTVLRNDGTDAISGTFLNAPEGAIFGGALNTAFKITYLGGDGNDVVITRVSRASFDFDADGKADLAVFRSTGGVWYLSQSQNGQRSVQFGASDDKIVPADYDGDNRTDIAVFRPSTGIWYSLRSSDNVFVGTQFGASGDVPVPNDFDGDGRADLAVFRPSTGTWYQLRSLGNQMFAQAFGQTGDKPLIGDYDGDGLGDLGVFRSGIWYLFESSTNALRGVSFGLANDKPVPADYDADGKTDLAVFRSGTWYIQGSTAGFSGIQFGLADDLPVPADFDGDGKTDVSVFRPSSGIWYLNRSTAGFTGIQFGTNGDQPIPNAYVQ